VAIWFMNGTTLINAPDIGNVSLSWTIQGAGADSSTAFSVKCVALVAALSITPRTDFWLRCTLVANGPTRPRPASQHFVSNRG